MNIVEDRQKKIPEEFIGKSFDELHTYFFSETHKICLGLFNNVVNVGISDILFSVFITSI